jgi:hypothetical protein
MTKTTHRGTAAVRPLKPRGTVARWIQARAPPRPGPIMIRRPGRRRSKNASGGRAGACHRDSDGTRLRAIARPAACVASGPGQTTHWQPPPLRLIRVNSKGGTGSKEVA